MTMRIADFRFRNKKSKILNSAIRIPQSQMGMTLLEIAISMAILAITLVTLANFFPIGLRASRRASNFSEAGILAQRVIDNIRRAAAVYEIDEPKHNPFDALFNEPDDWSYGDGIGYFELVNRAPYAFPFSDSDLADSSWSAYDKDNYSIYLFEYPNTNMRVYVKSKDWDANDSGGLDINDLLLSQKVFVAVYWTEGEVERADTFVTYIANPFYEKYK